MLYAVEIKFKDYNIYRSVSNWARQAFWNRKKACANLIICHHFPAVFLNEKPSKCLCKETFAWWKNDRLWCCRSVCQSTVYLKRQQCSTDLTDRLTHSRPSHRVRSQTWAGRLMHACRRAKPSRRERREQPASTVGSTIQFPFSFICTYQCFFFNYNIYYYVYICSFRFSYFST